MYQHFNTRARLIRRILTYVLMCSAILIGVIGTSAWIMGYRFDLGEQEVKQINLVQVGTFPTGAKVAIDDRELSWTTPGRYDELEAGWHKVKYWREGYRDWNKTLNLKAAEVRWLDYARLVPREIETKDIANFAGAHQALTSPNGGYIILHESPEDLGFKLIDISDANNVKVTDLVLPEDIASGEVKIVEWDSSSNYLLADAGGEILRIDRRTPSESQNLSKLFNVSIVTPHFLDGNNNVIYALTDSMLRQFDVSAKTVSVPVLKDVSNYELYGDGKIAFVTQNENGQDVGVWYKEKEYIYRHYDEAKPTLANFTHYWRDDYLLMLRDGKLEIIDEPFESEHSVVSINVDASDFLTHNGSGRLIMVGGGGRVMTYDLQVEELYSFETEGTAEKPFWIDDYHIGYINNGVLRTSEFDGTNSEDLVQATFFGVYSGNNEHLFTFLPTESGVVFRDSSMLVK